MSSRRYALVRIGGGEHVTPRHGTQDMVGKVEALCASTGVAGRRPPPKRWHRPPSIELDHATASPMSEELGRPPELGERRLTSPPHAPARQARRTWARVSGTGHVMTSSRAPPQVVPPSPASSSLPVDRDAVQRWAVEAAAQGPRADDAPPTERHGTQPVCLGSEAQAGASGVLVGGHRHVRSRALPNAAATSAGRRGSRPLRSSISSVPGGAPRRGRTIELAAAAPTAGPASSDPTARGDRPPAS